MHTPGPWLVYDSKHKAALDDLENLGERTWVVYGDSFNDKVHHIAWRMTEANARLIATVPDMLGTLEEIASGECCQSPGCNLDEPLCNPMIARAALCAALSTQ